MTARRWQTVALILLPSLGLAVVVSAQTPLAEETSSYFANPHAISAPEIGRAAGPYVISDRATDETVPIEIMLQEAATAERAGNIAVATNMYRRALAQHGNDRTLLLHFARLKHRAGDMRGAIVLYQTVLQEHPNDVVTINDLALCYARVDQLENAISLLTTAVNTRPHNKRYRNNLATLLVQTNQIERARDILVESHGLAIGNYNLGVLLTQAHRKAEALSYFNAALQADPSLTPAREMIVSLVEQTPQLAERNGANSTEDAARLARTPDAARSSDREIETQSATVPLTGQPGTYQRAVFYQNGGVVNETSSGQENSDQEPPDVQTHPIPKLACFRALRP